MDIAYIGIVGLHRFSFDAPFSPGWEIGWRISDKFWHNGYATEAAKACLDYAREKRRKDAKGLLPTRAHRGARSQWARKYANSVNLLPYINPHS